MVDDLAKIAKEDLGNIILIDKDFKYEKQSTLQQEDDTYRNDGVVDISIDERQSDNRRKFHFDEDNKPVLVVEDGKDISSLLNIPAARRQKKVQK